MANEFVESSEFTEKLIRACVLNKCGWYDRTFDALLDVENVNLHVKRLREAESAICRATDGGPGAYSFTGTKNWHATAHTAAAWLLLHLLRLVALNHLSADSDNVQRAHVANKAYELGSDAQRLLAAMRIERSKLGTGGAEMITLREVETVCGGKPASATIRNNLSESRKAGAADIPVNLAGSGERGRYDYAAYRDWHNRVFAASQLPASYHEFQEDLRKIRRAGGV